MYRSQLSIDPGHPSMRQALADCQDMHRNIMKAFPEENVTRKEARVLYRLMTVENRPVLFVLSGDLPDWSRVPGLSLYRGMPPRAYDDIQSAFLSGRTLRFSLRASPCKKMPGDGKNSKRVFLRTPEERKAWLIRKAEQNGFLLLQMSETAPDVLRGSKGDNTFYYRTVVFEGVLRITDTVRFTTAFENGIGPGKAYGLGLLLLMRETGCQRI